jgi:hypothetical protein
LSKISTNKRKTILEKLEWLRLDSYRENNNIKMKKLSAVLNIDLEDYSKLIEHMHKEISPNIIILDYHVPD